MVTNESKDFVTKLKIERSVIMTIEKMRSDMVAAIDEGCRDNIPEELVDRVILKEIKSVKEQIDTCPDSRAELKAEYQARYDIMNEYAPKLLSADEIREILTTKYADVVATKNRGQIMKNVMGELKGKADGKLINQIVGELCK